MRSELRALPIGLLAGSPADRTRRWGAPWGRGPGVVVINRQVAHQVALTVAKLPGPRWKG